MKKNINKFLSVAALSTIVATTGAYEAPIASANDSTAVDAKTSITQLSSFYSDSYNQKFRVSPSDIKVSANADSYSGYGTANLIDGDVNTHWVSSKNNSSTFENELTFTFKDTTTINRLLFAPQVKGVMYEDYGISFEIYASTENSGDNNFKLISSASFNAKVTDKVVISFTPTEAKRVKFVFKKTDFGIANASEFMFYKEDDIAKTVQSIFTDKTMSAVVPAYNSIEELDALEQKIQKHPQYDSLKADIDLAKKIVNGEYNVAGTIIKAEQVGDRRAIIQEKLRSKIGSELQPTGFFALAGQKINVYVEAGSSGKLPSMTFTQHEGSYTSWKKTVPLKEGKNVITVPTIPVDSNYSKKVTKGGPIYITNPYTADEQGDAPLIRIEGAEKFPLMTKDTSPEEFRKEVQAFAAKVDRDVAANPNIEDRKIINVMEIVSDHVILTGSNTSAFRAFVISRRNPMDILNSYDTWMHKIFDFHGFDNSDEMHDPTLIRENIRLMQEYGLMYAAIDHTGINGMQDVAMTYNLNDIDLGWAYNHEIGHRIENPSREYPEVTNNMTAMHMSVLSGNPDTRIPYDSIYKYVIEENKIKRTSQGEFAQLAPFWQLEVAYPGYWAKMEKLYREKAVTTWFEEEKQQQLVRLSSEALGKDLSSHFARHGFTVTEATRTFTSQFDDAGKTWYMNNTAINYKGNGFADTTTVEASIQKTDTQNTLNFTVNDAAKADLLGYEIVRDGKVIAFTRSTSYVDSSVEEGNTHNYEVVAYDKNLKTISTTLGDTVLSADEHNADVADKTYATVVSVVTDVLTEHAGQLAQIEKIYMLEPETFHYVGNDLEEIIVEEIREGIKGKFTGSLSVVLTDYANFTTVDEFMEQGLSVGYQASDDTPYYSYHLGKLTVYK